MKIYLYDISQLNIEEAMEKVSKERKEKASKCRADMDKRRSLGVDLLLSHALKELCPELTVPAKLIADENSKLHIEFDGHDKAILEQSNIVGYAGGTIEFSVSHSGKYVALILADDCHTEVGIDIEKQKDSKNGIAARFFTEEECAVITTRQRMFVYWTLKESFLKAIGLGLKYPMNKFKAMPEGDLDDKQSHGSIYVQNEFEGTYYGKSFNIAPDYNLSICTHNYDCRDVLDNSIIFV